jgi:hypothetical protein
MPHTFGITSFPPRQGLLQSKPKSPATHPHIVVGGVSKINRHVNGVRDAMFTSFVSHCCHRLETGVAFNILHNGKDIWEAVCTNVCQRLDNLPQKSLRSFRVGCVICRCNPVENDARPNRMHTSKITATGPRQANWNTRPQQRIV